jgi:putative hydrolases of HD superfamily
MEFYELDKQAHKMMIAYFFSSFEDDYEDIYLKILRGGLFEFLQRVVITDIKPPVFKMIQKDRIRYKKLNQYIIEEAGDILELFGESAAAKFLEYFEGKEDTRERRILSAAHIYSSIWEFDIIRSINPNSHDNNKIHADLMNAYKEYSDLKGVRELAGNDKYMKFIQICGDLRFQSRWSHLHRIPKTSVLGHSLYVAWLAYYFSIKSGHCRSRIYNNYVGALFHDLPEALTRDIISPIKRSVEGLMDLIKDYEEEQMEEMIYPLLPKRVKDELGIILKYEFSNRIMVSDKYVVTEHDDIDEAYNLDQYQPYDGEMIKACDDLAAFIEAASAISNGCVSREFGKAMDYITDKYSKRGPINGHDFCALMERLVKDI